MTEQQHLSFALNTGLAHRWREREPTHQKKTERWNGISSLVSHILDQIPAEDRALMTVESWWQMTEAESGRSLEQTFDTDLSIDNDLEKLLNVLLLRSSEPPCNLHGLRAARAIEEAISRKAGYEAKALGQRAQIQDRASTNGGRFLLARSRFCQDRRDRMPNPAHTASTRSNVAHFRFHLVPVDPPSSHHQLR
ncbi:hypothetical protein NKH74_32355 [Mesorhizobium sp. M0933]|uniref:hypothetical protein n=1 Tax=Mesorhizobium sp. M0933 TaxID=2957030 RepID=UPI0033361582